MDRLLALGAQLVAVHDELRGRLQTLRDHDGEGSATPLAAHCLAFCGALTQHHTGEDANLFPALLEQDPRLAGVLEQLRHDHVLIAGLLAELETAAQQLPGDPTPVELERFQGRVDGIAAICESHFRFEERRVAAELDRWPSATATPSWDVR